MKALDTLSAIVLTLIILADGYVWHRIISDNLRTRGEQGSAVVQFLDVGQGDSQLLTTHGVQIMSDFGPGQETLRRLEEVVPASDRYIDIAIITHPDLDHFGGLSYVLEHYTFGAILWNGYIREPGSSKEWDALIATIAERNIPFISLEAGDRLAYRDAMINILSPDPLLLSGGATNDAALVQEIRTPDFSVLLTGDIGGGVEEYLAQKHILRPVDILKIAHHGSRFSSQPTFLGAVAPQVAVIQSGRGNTYGHPHADTLTRIQSAGIANVLRTDEHGTITIRRAQGALTFTGSR